MYSIGCKFDLGDHVAHKYSDERAVAELGDYRYLDVIGLVSASEVRVRVVGGRWDGATEIVPTGNLAVVAAR